MKPCGKCGSRRRGPISPSWAALGRTQGPCLDCKNLGRRRDYQTPKYRAERLLRSARSQTKKTGTACDLTLDWVERRIQRGFCEVTGLAFVLTPYRVAGGRHPRAPSLDRISAGKGYTRRNVRLVVWQFNSAKHTYPDSVLRELVRQWVKNDPSILE